MQEIPASSMIPGVSYIRTSYEDFNQLARALHGVHTVLSFLVTQDDPVSMAQKNLIDAASDLGASTTQTFLRVVLPLSLPGVMSGCVMVFLLASGAYVTPQLLGGASAVMFGNLIAAQFLSDNNWGFGASLSVIMMVVVLAFVLLAGSLFGLRRIFMGGQS